MIIFSFCIPLSENDSCTNQEDLWYTGPDIRAKVGDKENCWLLYKPSDQHSDERINYSGNIIKE